MQKRLRTDIKDKKRKLILQPPQNDHQNDFLTNEQNDHHIVNKRNSTSSTKKADLH